ncbi:MAG: tRNA pseudouridine(55) synthase TruB [Clostridium sp.]|nr:tRNA pseudouridine(55) synthase TruB [Clostridium sp.]MCM1397957.1 tRNA pseudouridine(55) synthase TruB [Clostridium sp.]MCM1459406.1 tRNA pseudouridine(55) synthase TruB [Bacteroides sp.]
MFDGILNVYKEQGYTSFDVVAKLRSILKQKKIGHTGTLDPMATGVLVVCLGKATKLVDMLIEGDKKYRASMLLGYQTDTEDVTGVVTKSSSMNPSDNEIRDAISAFVGGYHQVPPMYSAIKVDGKKLYEYAREGKTVERVPRQVEIYSIENVNVYNLDTLDMSLNESFGKTGKQRHICVDMDVHCSKGTYIRSLCRDIGGRLGCFATLMALERMEAHGNRVEHSFTLGEIEAYCKAGTIGNYIQPLDSLLGAYGKLKIKDAYQSFLLNGNKLKEAYFEEIMPDRSGMFRVYLGNEMKALYRYDEREKLFRPEKMFL